jgi:hypothetical protein
MGIAGDKPRQPPSSLALPDTHNSKPNPKVLLLWSPANRYHLVVGGDPADHASGPSFFSGTGRHPQANLNMRLFLTGV